MTAAELHALVQNWPEEAKAKGTRYIGQPDPDKPDYPDCWAAELSANMTSCLHTHHAISLHVASGLEWLAHQREAEANIVVSPWAGEWKLFWDDMTRRDMADVPRHPTLLHAISAAITATRGGG